MSSAASSQDSLHRGLVNPYHPYHHLMVGTTSPGQVPVGPGGLPGKKQRGVKSTLGRIFGTGKKDKMKVMKDGVGGSGFQQSPVAGLSASLDRSGGVGGNPYVTPPLTSSPSGGFTTPTASSQQFLPHQQHQPHQPYDCDIPSSDSMAGGLGNIAGKGDFDRRKKKKYVILHIYHLHLAV